MAWIYQNRFLLFHPQYFLDYRLYFILEKHTIPAEKRNIIRVFRLCRTGVNFLCLLNLSFVFQTFAPPITLIFIVIKLVIAWEVLHLAFLAYNNLIIFKWMNPYQFQNAGQSKQFCEYIFKVFLFIAQRCLRFVFEISAMGNKKGGFCWCFWQAINHAEAVNCWFSTPIRMHVQLKCINKF